MDRHRTTTAMRKASRSDRIEMVGRKYGHLTVLAEAGYRRYPRSSPRRLVLVQCDCGAEYVVRAETVRRGAGKSRPVNSCQSCAARDSWARALRGRSAA
jgi:hypothetical protein